MRGLVLVGLWLTAAVVFNLTCLVEPLYPFGKIRVDLNHQSDAVIERALFATDFWESKGFSFDYVEDVGATDIVLHNVSEHPTAKAGGDLLSALSHWPGEPYRIYIRPGDYSPINLDCLTTRAFGFALGLREIEDAPPGTKSLMDVSSPWISSEEPCPWSEYDEGVLAEAY